MNNDLSSSFRLIFPYLYEALLSALSLNNHLFNSDIIFSFLFLFFLFFLLQITVYRWQRFYIVA